MASEACPGPSVSWGRSAVLGCELPRAGHLGVLRALRSTKADGPWGRKQHQGLARDWPGKGAFRWSVPTRKGLREERMLVLAFSEIVCSADSLQLHFF